MATRTVRLDDETDEVLQRLRRVTGLSISEILKRGIQAIWADIEQEPARTAHAIYSELDLGEGGYSIEIPAGGQIAEAKPGGSARRRASRPMT